MKTKKPSAILYNWYKEGEELISTNIYHEEKLYEDVIVYSLPYTDDVVSDFTKYQPDIIVSFGQPINVPHYQLQRIHTHFNELVSDDYLGNFIVTQATYKNLEVQRPRFSIFTPTYKTGERIFRTYESLRNQVWTNWEWVIVDDSPDDDTWDTLKEIAKNDYRVKLHKIFPLTGGNVGLAKHRAAHLCEGDWLVELDHDDALTSECLSTCNAAICEYPDAGFLYTDCCEMYDDGEMKYYDHDWTGNYYGRPDNYFDFGYAGHSWTEVDGQKVLAHWYPNINPLTIRFNISMPNHTRMWERKLYLELGGHNRRTPVADDLEMIIKTFLKTRFIHVRKVLYFQFNNRNSTVDNNAQDINRRARIIRDYYDKQIHQRISDLGFVDWCWDENLQHCHKFQNHQPVKKYFEDEQVMNYIYE